MGNIHAHINKKTQKKQTNAGKPMRQTITPHNHHPLLNKSPAESQMEFIHHHKTPPNNQANSTAYDPQPPNKAQPSNELNRLRPSTAPPNYQIKSTAKQSPAIKRTTI